MSLIRSLRYAEISTLVLGLGFTTLAMAARIYTKLHLTKVMRREDCKCRNIWSARRYQSLIC